MGFRVWGLGLRVPAKGSEFRVLRVSGSGFRVLAFGFRAEG